MVQGDGGLRFPGLPRTRRKVKALCTCIKMKKWKNKVEECEYTSERVPE